MLHALRRNCAIRQRCNDKSKERLRRNCGDVESLGNPETIRGNEQQTKKELQKIGWADRHQQQQNGPAFLFFKFFLYLPSCPKSYWDFWTPGF